MNIILRQTLCLDHYFADFFLLHQKKNHGPALKIK